MGKRGDPLGLSLQREVCLLLRRAKVLSDAVDVFEAASRLLYCLLSPYPDSSSSVHVNPADVARIGFGRAARTVAPACLFEIESRD